jgi:hypothetical protein
MFSFIEVSPIRLSARYHFELDVKGSENDEYWAIALFAKNISISEAKEKRNCSKKDTSTIDTNCGTDDMH